MNQGLILEEMKNPHLRLAITGGRQEAPTVEMNTIGQTTSTKMTLERKDISLTKPKIFGRKMDTPTEEALEGLLTMIGMNIPEA